MTKKKKDKQKSTSCGAVVWRVVDDRYQILLIKQFQNKDSWGIPKGHINKGESHEECALREVFEETGVAVRLGAKLNPTNAIFRHEIKTVISYLARPTGNEEPSPHGPESEVADAKWFFIDELPQIHMYQQILIASTIKLLLAKKNVRDFPDNPKESKIYEALDEVFIYAHDVDEWIVIKKELLKLLHPTDRKLFSTRDPITKKQCANEFERVLAERWSGMTGRDVILI